MRESEKQNPLNGLFRITRLRAVVVGLMFLLVLMLGDRAVSFMRQAARGKKLPEIAPVMAETAKEADKKEVDKAAEAPKEMPKDATPPAEAKPAEAKPAESQSAEVKPAEAKAEVKPAAPQDAADAEQTDAEAENFSDAEVTILKRLSERRKELDTRSGELDQREALLKVTEQRVDKKITDLRAMKEEIIKIVGDANEQQKAQAASIVKIYETMKPKEAAKIFENLELPVLIEVVRKMKEARVAAVMGAMDPVKAKELTAALMEKKNLPTPP